MQNCVFVRFLHRLFLTRLLGLNQLGFVQLGVDAQRFELVSRQPLPGSFGVEEEDQVVRGGVTAGHVQHILGRDWDGDPVVEVTRARHLRVDDEGRVPGVASTLGPDEIERFEGDSASRRCGVAWRVVRIRVVGVRVAVLGRVVVFGGGDDVGRGSGLSVVVGFASYFATAAVNLEEINF